MTEAKALLMYAKDWVRAWEERAKIDGLPIYDRLNMLARADTLGGFIAAAEKRLEDGSLVTWCTLAEAREGEAHQ